MPRWWTAPNLLTIGRLLLAPLVVWRIVAGDSRQALGLLAAAALTDFLDGFAARVTKSQSHFGELLDPVADKVLLSGVFLALAYTGAVPVWFVGIVFARDLVLLLASAFVMSFTSVSDLRPTIYGKASTALQILVAGTFVASPFAPELASFGNFCLWPAAVLTAFSGIHYLWRGVRLRNRVDA
jgi:cardiolipin synthase